MKKLRSNTMNAACIMSFFFKHMYKLHGLDILWAVSKKCGLRVKIFRGKILTQLKANKNLHF